MPGKSESYHEAWVTCCPENTPLVEFIYLVFTHMPGQLPQDLSHQRSWEYTFGGIYIHCIYPHSRWLTIRPESPVVLRIHLWWNLCTSCLPTCQLPQATRVFVVFMWCVWSANGLTHLLIGLLLFPRVSADAHTGTGQAPHRLHPEVPGSLHHLPLRAHKEVSASSGFAEALLHGIHAFPYRWARSLSPDGKVGCGV